MKKVTSFVMVVLVVLVLAARGVGLRDPGFVAQAGKVEAAEPPAGPPATAATNTTPIVISSDAHNDPADPYPSVITMDLHGFLVRGVIVDVLGLTHTYPDDMVVVLEGPGGETVKLMDQLGGDASASGVTFTFDDTAAVGLSEGAVVTNGSYKVVPGGTHILAASGPQGPYGTNLAVFVDAPAGGDWKLWLMDYYAGDAGAIGGGWGLRLEVVPTNAIVLALESTNLTQGVAISNAIVATGGQAPYSNSVYSGTLPDGCYLTNNGALGGTPTSYGTYTFALLCTDATNATKKVSLTVWVGGILTASLPEYLVGNAYSNQLQVTNIGATYGSWVSAGELPGGLTLSEAGLFSGTATNGTTNTFTVTVTNANWTCSREYTLSPFRPSAAYVTNLAVYYPMEDESGATVIADSHTNVLSLLRYTGTGLVSRTNGVIGNALNLTVAETTRFTTNSPLLDTDGKDYACRFWFKYSGEADKYLLLLGTYFDLMTSTDGAQPVLRVRAWSSDAGNYVSALGSSMAAAADWHRVVAWQRWGEELGIKVDNSPAVTVSAGTWPATEDFVKLYCGVGSSVFAIDELAVWVGYIPSEQELEYDWNDGAGRGKPE